MVVVWRMQGGSYILSELDGAVSTLCYTALRLLPYFPRSRLSIPVTRLLDLAEDELDMMTQEDKDLDHEAAFEGNF